MVNAIVQRTISVESGVQIFVRKTTVFRMVQLGSTQLKIVGSIPTTPFLMVTWRSGLTRMITNLFSRNRGAGSSPAVTYCQRSDSLVGRAVG